MGDVYPPEVRSRVMKSITKKNTTPELRVRHILFKLGYRYALHRKDLPGSPDIVLPRFKTVIQINGCFWHQHDCKLGKLPKSNHDYWLPKFRRIAERDAGNARLLRDLGWRIITIWECQTFDSKDLEQNITSRPELERHTVK